MAQETGFADRGLASGVRAAANIVGWLLFVAFFLVVVLLEPPHCTYNGPIQVMPAESVDGLAYCGVVGRASRAGYVFTPTGVYPASQCTKNKADIPTLQARLEGNQEICTGEWRLSAGARRLFARILG